MKTHVTFSLRRAAAVLAISVFFCGASSATTLYTNLGPGDSFESGADYQVDVEQQISANFIPLFTGWVDEIRIAVQWFQGPNSFTIHLHGDDGGVPGSILESWNVTNFPSTPSLLTLTSVINPTVISGNQYWVTIDSGADETTDSETQSHTRWFYSLFSLNDLGVASRHRDSADDPWGAWDFGAASVKPALDVTGGPVPEPSTIGLALAGLAAVIVRRKWGRRT